MDAQGVYTGRCTRRFDDCVHFAQVCVTAVPTTEASSVRVAEEADAGLKVVFGEDAEFLARHCVRAGVEVQIGWANVSGDMPRVRRTNFAVEVVGVRVSGNAGRERSGFLLTVAAMEAISAYLEEFERL